MAVRVGTSIRLKLALLVGVVVVLLAAALSLASYLFAHRTLSEQIGDRLSIVAGDRRRMLLEYVRRQEERAALVASRTRLRALLADLGAGRVEAVLAREQIDRILVDAQRTSQEFVGMWVADSAGQVVGSTDAQRWAGDVSGMPEFQEGKQHATMGVIHRIQGRYQMVVAAPAREDNAVVGVVLMLVDATPLLRTLSDATGLGESGEVIVGMRAGDRVHYLVPTRYGREIPDGLLDPSSAIARALAEGSGFGRGKDYRGAEVLAAYAPVGYRQWGIVAKMDVEEAYAPIAWLRRTFMVVEFSVLVVGVMASYLVARRFTNPIRRMASMAEAIADGGLDARVVVETNDEVGALARAFNRMTAEVAYSQAVLEDRVRARTADLAGANETLQAEIVERRRAEQQLAEQQALLQSLMDNLPDNVYFKDTHSRFIRVNQAQLKWMGLDDPRQMEGRTDFHFFAKEHAQPAYEDEQEVMRTGQPIIGKEEREVWPDGRVTWVSTTKVPLRDKDGRISGTFGVSRDITSRKNAEQRLEKYAHALTRRTIQTQEDLVLAREIQMAFLPQHYPTFPRGVAVAESALQFQHRYQPASTLGGDFFDVRALSETEAGVLICDVMGHGMRSALVTAILRGLVNESREYADDPGEFLTQINQRLLTSLKSCGTPIFATAFYLVVDAATGQLLYANAGHPSPLCLRPDRGTADALPGSAHGAALGLFAETRFVTQRDVLAPQDSVLMFTDGLYEVQGHDGAPYGQERLLEAVRHRLALPATQLLDELIADARRFSSTGDFSDDVCLLTAGLAKSVTATTGVSVLEKQA